MRGAARAVALAGALTCIVAGRADAQSDTLGYSTQAPRWVGQFTSLSANAMLGGLTAGIFQELRGGSFKDGFARGAFGGTIIYGGKWLVAGKFGGAGLIGREVAAVGASVVRNASDGRGSFDRLILPAGVVRVYWDRTRHDINARLDVVAAGYLVYGVVEDELDFDAHASLNAGTAVFKTQNKVIAFGDSTADHAAGLTESGIVFRSDVAGWGDEFLQRALRHERVHVVQDDQLFITLNDHLDDWVFAHLGPARGLGRYIDLNGSTEFLKLLGGYIPKHADRPWELEAIYLTR